MSGIRTKLPLPRKWYYKSISGLNLAQSPEISIFEIAQGLKYYSISSVGANTRPWRPCALRSEVLDAVGEGGLISSDFDGKSKSCTRRRPGSRRAGKRKSRTWSVWAKAASLRAP